MAGGAQQELAAIANADAQARRKPCELWGVLNVTPDSFHDGGQFVGLDAAVAQACRMAAAGAAVIDVGGESSRPPGSIYGVGATAVSAAEEIARVLPVIERLVGDHGLRLSIDTTKGAVARAALAAGATIVNDVTGGADPELLRAVADAGADLVLMHSRGRGEGCSPNVDYDDVVGDVRRELGLRVRAANEAGIGGERLWLDPGLGFAKTADQSLALLAATERLCGDGLRVLVGPSRKSFIGELAAGPDGQRPPPSERLPGTMAAVAIAVLGGAHAVRVHDVAEARQALCVATAVRALAAPTSGRRAA